MVGYAALAGRFAQPRVWVMGLSRRLQTRQSARQPRHIFLESMSA
jgi:hypothetical protein